MATDLRLSTRTTEYAYMHKIKTTGQVAPSNEPFYGPWNTIKEAYDDILSVFKKADNIPIGLTIGILDTTTLMIKDYWLVGGRDMSNFIEKTGNADVKVTVEITPYLSTEEGTKALPTNVSYVLNGFPVQSRSLNVLKTEIGIPLDESEPDNSSKDILVFFDHDDSNSSNTYGTYYIFDKSTMQYLKSYNTGNNDVPSKIFDAFWSEGTSINGQYLTIEIGGVKYVIPGASQAIKPDVPTSDAKTTDYTASATLTLKCATSGATIYHKHKNNSVEKGTYTSYSAGNKFTLSQDNNYEIVEYKVILRSALNGIYSNDSSEITVHIKRQLSAPTITVASHTIFDNSTTATITYPSGASCYYTLDGKTPTTSSTPYTSGNITISNSGTVIKAIVVKDKWIGNSNSSSAITIKRLKTYAGVGPASITSLSALTANNIDTLDTLKNTTFDLGPTTSANKYFWICVPTEITTDTLKFKDAVEGFGFPVETMTVTGIKGYTLYRSGEQSVDISYKVKVN